MPIARKIPKPAGRFWLCSAIRTKYDNTINRHCPAWFPHGYYPTFSSLCHYTISVIARHFPLSVIARTPQRHFPTLSPLCHYTISVIARLDRAIHHFMSCFSDAPVKPEYDNNKGHYFLVYVIARHSPLSVIARLDRAIHYFLSRFLGYSGYAFGIFNLQNKNYLLK